MLEWSSPLQYLKGVGPVKAGQLAKLGLFTVGQLLEYFPVRYEDQSRLTAIASLIPGQLQTFQGRVMLVNERRVRRGLTILTITVSDGTGAIELVWFNQPFLKKKYQVGRMVRCYGKIEKHFSMRAANPETEVVEEEDPFSGRIQPVYRLVENVAQNLLRGLVEQILQAGVLIPEVLPESVRREYGLMDRAHAFHEIHEPESTEILDQAVSRLKFEELFLLQCGLLAVKAQNQKPFSGIKHGIDGMLSHQVMAALPFTLTGDQQQAWRDIRADMEDSQPMQRLLQGDVGSGKTVVAALALVKTVENGFQGALMAPTEILAEQHFTTLSKLLAPLGIKLGLLTGSKTKKQKEKVGELLAAGAIDVIIGTHALIQEYVQFRALGLIVTDEQHRFGVKQRAKLQEKGNEPDVLVMTATPIPRTMALTIYGDLDVSLIQTLPPGRKPIRTFLRGVEKREAIYRFVADEIRKGRQAYVVCPLVEESEKVDTQAAVQWFEMLKNSYFEQIPCGLIHGKMKAAEKDQAMTEFYQNHISLLVATTVIEVGVNVPNATVMVVEGAERFGLSQLHQLRGRIGRGAYQSYCILISKAKTGETYDRLKVMTESSDGFKIAEQDLLLRGPGQFFGTRQHGLPDLKIANIVTDLEILLRARAAAQQAITSDSYRGKLPKLLKDYFGGSFTHILQN